MHLILTQPDTTIAHLRRVGTRAKGQMLILVPEASLVSVLGTMLSDLAPLLISSGLKKKQQTSAVRAIADGSARVVIGTRMSLFLPWKSLTDIIVEDPLNEAYKSDMTPRYNAPDAARELARIHGASLTYLTPALSAANHYLVDKKIFSLTDRKSHWPNIVMADMVQERSRGNHSILSSHAQSLIAHGQKNILFYSPRKAYASLLRCQNCHKSAACTTCSIPMRVHRTSEDMLVCYHCSAYRTLPKQCSACKSGPLRPSGIPGSQKIAHAIGGNIPILDSDLVKTTDDEREVFARFEALDQPILVATQMIFSHRYDRKFDHIVIVGADALAYNPDFRTHERLAYQFEKLSDLMPETMIIQYWDERGAVSYAPNRDWKTLYDHELTERKALGWPPFVRIVKLSLSHHDRSASSRQASIVADRLTRAATHLAVSKSITILGPTPALVERAGGKWAQQIILKTTLAPEKTRELLAHVPAGTVIDVDPRSIS